MQNPDPQSISRVHGVVLDRISVWSDPLLGIGIFAIAAFITGVGTTGTGAGTIN